MGDILVIEDNEDIATGLRDNLELEGHGVRTAGMGAAGIAEAKTWNPDVIVLDLGLPDMEGHQVIRVLRREGVKSGVLILSARDAEAEKVVGLRLGAEDYVTKPFGMLELLARVETILRRGRVAAAPRGIVSPHRVTTRLGALEIDGDARQVKRNGELVSLWPKEFDLLDALMRRDRAEGRLSHRDVT